MTSREDLGRLAYAAHCDMVGRPSWPWDRLAGVDQAGWIHAAVTVRDRLQLGMSHAYRPDDRQEESAMALPRSTAHGGSDEPHVTATDDAEVYARQRAVGNNEIKWTGEGHAPDGDSDGDSDGAEGGESRVHVKRTRAISPRHPKH
jgi:hypothetical protein